MLAMRAACSLFAILVFASSLIAQSKPSGALTPQIQAVLNGIKAADKGQLAVSDDATI